MTHNGNRKFLKVILAVVLIICAGAAGVAVWISQHYKAVIKDKLPGWVSKSTNGLYYISFEDVGINILTRRITVNNIKIWHDTARMRELSVQGKAPQYYFDMNLPKVQVSGIVWEELIGDKELGCAKIYFSRPKVIVTQVTGLQDSLKDTTKKEPKIQRVFADELEVKNGIFVYRKEDSGSQALLYLNGSNIMLKDCEYIPGEPQDTTKFLFAKSATLSFRQLVHKKTGWLYALRTKRIYFESLKDSAALSGVSINAIVNKREFYRRTGKQIDKFDVKLPEVKLSRLNWRKLLYGGELNAEEITIKNAVFSDYFSRLAPPNMESKYGKYPSQLLQKIKFPINIRHITLTNATGSYTEVSNVTKKPGTLLFTHTNGDITNITNMEDAIKVDKNCVVKLRGKFMHRSDIAATFNFLLTSKNGAFSVSSYLKDVNAEQINKTAQALALAEIKSLHISRMDVSITGNERYAKAHLKLLYEDMKIKLQKMNKDSTESKRMGFLSFLANNILLYPANPMPGNDVRIANTYIARDKYKSFFNLIWKNIFEGTIKTAARNDDIIELLQKKDTAKQEAADSEDDDPQGLFESIFNKKDDKEKLDKKERRQERRKKRQL